MIKCQLVKFVPAKISASKKFLADELRKSSTVSLSCRSSNSTENWPILLYKRQANYKNFCNLWLTSLSSLQLQIDPFDMAFLRWQRPTHFDKCGNVLLFFWHSNTNWVSCRVAILMQEIIGGVVRHCESWTCRENFLLHGIQSYWLQDS